jgi:WD40 repeat protein
LLIFCPSALFASGSRDGSIMVWDARGSIHLKAENVIKNAHPIQGKLIVPFAMMMLV